MITPDWTENKQLNCRFEYKPLIDCETCLFFNLFILQTKLKLYASHSSVSHNIVSLCILTQTEVESDFGCFDPQLVSFNGVPSSHSKIFKWFLLSPIQYHFLSLILERKIRTRFDSICDLIMSNVEFRSLHAFLALSLKIYCKTNV